MTMVILFIILMDSNRISKQTGSMQVMTRPCKIFALNNYAQRILLYNKILHSGYIFTYLKAPTKVRVLIYGNREMPLINSIYAKDSLFFLIVVQSATSLLFVILCSPCYNMLLLFFYEDSFSYYKSNANNSSGYMLYCKN